MGKPRIKPVFNYGFLWCWNYSVPIEVTAAVIKFRNFVGTCCKHYDWTIRFGAFTVIRRVNGYMLHYLHYNISCLPNHRSSSFAPLSRRRMKEPPRYRETSVLTYSKLPHLRGI